MHWPPMVSWFRCTGRPSPNRPPGPGAVVAEAGPRQPRCGGLEPHGPLSRRRVREPRSRQYICNRKARIARNCELAWTVHWQIRPVPIRLCEENGPSAQPMGSSGLAGLCREQQRLGSNGTGPSALRGCSRDPASGAAWLDHTTCAPSTAPLAACACGTRRTCRETWGWRGRAAPHRS